MRIRALVLLVVGLLVSATLVAPPATAAVSLALDGRGYGHGIGMSQYGAKGRAEAGHTYSQILANYYPGTTLATSADSNGIRVLIQSDNDGITQVRAEASMLLRTSKGSVALPTAVEGTSVSQWRLRTVSGSLILEALTGSTWRSPGTPGVSTILSGATTADFLPGDATIQLVLGSVFREYSGYVRATLTSPQRTVVVTTFANYLPSVVTSEMPSSWHAQALAAQAVAARTYAMFDQRSKSSGAVYDTCDTTSCQVFNGNADYNSSGTLIRSYSAPSTRTAVTSTAGRYLAYSGAPAFTQFSASNGGYSVAGSRPYLVAKADAFDALSAWHKDVTSTQLQNAYPSIGTFRSLTATRDGRGDYGGRITSMTITGSSGSVTVTGASFRSTFALRSTLFAISTGAANAPERDFTADGVPDIIARNTSGQLFLWPGRGGSFGTATQIGTGWNTIGAVTLAIDIRAGGRPELVAVERGTGALYSYPWSGSGFGQRLVIGSRGWSSMNVIIGVNDFAGAGSAGIIARQASTGNLLYYPATGSGLGAASVIGTGWSGMTRIIKAGDFNGDNVPDLLATDANGGLWLYTGTGTGRVRSGIKVGHGWGFMANLVGGTDWTGDGVPDLMTTDSSGALWVYPGNGRGRFLAREAFGKGWSTYSLIG